MHICIYVYMNGRGHQGDSLLHCGASTAQLSIVNFCLQVEPNHSSSLLTFRLTIKNSGRHKTGHCQQPY